MKLWSNIGTILVMASLPALASAQEMVPIGTIQAVESSEATTWSMSGFEIIPLRVKDGNDTPITRSLKMDARTVEILSRTQTPPLRASDVKVMNHRGKTVIVVRRYYLTDVKPADARAEKTSVNALAQRWAASARRALPAVAPLPSRFGI